MKKVNTVDAVGHVLCHDITQIIKDVTKDVVFKKGHIVQVEDIPVLLSVGKDHLFVWEKEENRLHENEAAEVLYKLCKGEFMHGTPVKEGKIDLVAEIDGVFKVDVERLSKVNALTDIMIATRHTNFPIHKGDKLAGTRIIPLVIETEKMEAAKKVAGAMPLLSILPYKAMRVGIVTTGSEVFYGRIEDTFTPVIESKLKAYALEVFAHETVQDDMEKIQDAIEKLIALGADMIVCTGGMSVDPDDVTPSAIKATGAELISYGAPVLPGAMFLLAYGKGDLPILGLPGCVMYAKSTIFDLVLPRIVAGEKLCKAELVKLGHGGLCLNCPTCNFPNCSFGK